MEWGHCHRVNCIKLLELVIITIGQCELVDNDSLFKSPPITLIDTTHSPLTILCLINSFKSLIFDDFIYDYKNGNYNEILFYLVSINWEYIFLDLNIDCATGKFYSIIF